MSAIVDIQTISVAIASTGVFAAAIYYISQIRHQNRLRETDLTTRIYSIVNDKELQKDCLRVVRCEFKDYDDFVKRFGSLSDEKFEQEPELRQSFANLANMGDFFGIVLKRKLVNADLLYETFSATRTWEKIKSIVEGEKKIQ